MALSEGERKTEVSKILSSLDARKGTSWQDSQHFLLFCATGLNALQARERAGSGVICEHSVVCCLCKEMWTHRAVLKNRSTNSIDHVPRLSYINSNGFVHSKSKINKTLFCYILRAFVKKPEIKVIRSRKTEITAVGIRCADHATPSIRKSWH
jgi:hypothetical protein